MHISVKCSVALHCLVFINEYGEYRKATGNLIAASAGVNPVTVRKILSALKKNGIISVKSGSGGASIAADPKKTTLWDICSAIEPDFLKNLIGIHSSPSPLCPVGRNINKTLDLSYDKIKEDLRASLCRITLGDVLENYKTAQKNG